MYPRGNSAGGGLHLHEARPPTWKNPSFFLFLRLRLFRASSSVENFNIWLGYVAGLFGRKGRPPIGWPGGV